MWKGARVHIPSREREGGPQSTLLRQRPYCALNDLAILYGGRDIIIAIRVTAGETLQVNWKTRGKQKRVVARYSFDSEWNCLWANNVVVFLFLLGFITMTC